MELIDEIINLILYGDIEEVPLEILGTYKHGPMDEEQYIRSCIAATIKDKYANTRN